MHMALTSNLVEVNPIFKRDMSMLNRAFVIPGPGKPPESDFLLAIIVANQSMSTHPAFLVNDDLPNDLECFEIGHAPCYPRRRAQ